MIKTIVGLDIGSWSIKCTKLDLRDHSIIGFDEFLHDSSRRILHERGASVQVSEENEADASVNDGGGENDHSIEQEDAPEREEGKETSPVWAKTLRSLVEESDLLRAEVICCNIPADLVTFLQIPVPFEDEDKVATILPSLLDSRLTAELSHFFWSFYVEKRSGAGDREHPFQARVALVERSELSQFIQQLHEAGLDPNQIVFTPLACAESLQFHNILGALSPKELALQSPSPDPSHTPNAVAFLDLGHQTTTLTVVDHSTSTPSIATARTTMMGVEHLADSIAKELSLHSAEILYRLHSFKGFHLSSTGEELPSEAEFRANEEHRLLVSSFQKSLRPLVRDIRRALQALYAQSKTQIGMLYLVGGGAKITGFAEELSRQLGIPVALFPATKISTECAQCRQNILSWALAIAAAEPVVRRRSCNFRHGSFLFRGRSSFLQKQMMIGIVAGLLLVILLFGVLYAQKASMLAQQRAMKAELALQTKTLFGTPLFQKKKIQTLFEGKGGGGEKGLIPTRSAFELGYEIVSHIPPEADLNISKFEVDTRRSIVQIRGDTTDAQAVDQLVSSLEEIRCIKDIKKERLNVRGTRADFELQINTEGCS